MHALVSRIGWPLLGLVMVSTANAATTVTGQISSTLILTSSCQVNGVGGSTGLNFGALNFGTVWAPLDGLGLLGSISFTESDLNPAPDGQTVRIPGLSGTVYNVTAYYERGGFEARVSQRKRTVAGRHHKWHRCRHQSLGDRGTGRAPAEIGIEHGAIQPVVRDRLCTALRVGEGTDDDTAPVLQNVTDELRNHIVVFDYKDAQTGKCGRFPIGHLMRSPWTSRAHSSA